MSRPAKLRSTIEGAGNGLFAVRPYKVDEVITHYGGQVQTKNFTKAGKYGPETHCRASVRGREVINGAVRGVGTLHRSGMGQYVNSDEDRMNAEFKNPNAVDDALQVRLVATKDIAAGEEIFVFYGEGYDFTAPSIPMDRSSIMKRSNQFRAKLPRDGRASQKRKRDQVETEKEARQLRPRKA